MALEEEKKKLIENLKAQGYLKTSSVIKAFQEVKRELFVTQEERAHAYWDVPLPIGKGQTISQPLTVAFMTELLDVKPGQKILEIGAGSGYQAAILAKIVGPKGTIYSTEIVPELVESAKENLKKVGIKNVKVFLSDGSLGLKDYAPYDRIIATAAAPNIPEPLKEQLKIGGKLVIPVGDFIQRMKLVEKVGEDRFKIEDYGEFRFVPLKGKLGMKE